MKKIVISIALLSLITLNVQADSATTPSTESTPNSSQTTQENSTAPAQNTTGSQNPTTVTPTNTTTPSTTGSLDISASSRDINCEYKIPPETTNIDTALILAWASNAVVKSFDFNHKDIDTQIASLQSCFTQPGWQGFSEALDKSGNISAIKSQNLMVSSQLDGQPELLESKDNQWKVKLPLVVIYKNDKEKLTQNLTVNLTIGRKTTGELGIMQLIAMPREAGVNTSGSQENSSPPSQPTTPPATNDNLPNQ